uniref:NADH dehydrogenase subunit 2 n=1 Tax=Contracaecum osculatum B sensu Nascetti et al. (1993) TaxID=999747 RepID=G1BWR4_9BILA|nr:NADH dehydrogenase subunit 2 [Contracaecum osculatum B sensu Nascetti et al. (1993)]AEK49011.1 NADH dehydrogenase subunit 2 [Contracaecum osculatum B sensu Nascetti et al. (1993)]AET08657.1 NADH dehydrogenase subunit 2 [Contracaecum osculatum B sensu Nascetti et al. (1993)]
MFIFMVFFVSMLCFLNFFTSNVVVWWSVFLLMTVVFVLLSKNLNSYSSIFNYFVIQESLGLFFLVFNFLVVQFFIVMLKIGVAPFHFWIFSVTNTLYDWLLMWFLTFQKLPFLPVLVQLFNFKMVFLFIFGIFLCYLQLFLLKSYKNMMIISSTESFNWIVLTCFLSVVNVLYLFFYYIILMIFLMPNFTLGGYDFINWETILVFLNIPFSVSFFIKIFSLAELFKLESLWVLFLLFSMFLSMLCFSLWLVNMSVKNFLVVNGNLKFSYFFVIPLTVLAVI